VRYEGLQVDDDDDDDDDGMPGSASETDEEDEYVQEANPRLALTTPVLHDL